MTERGRVIALAVALDLLMGEPPERWHPVVGMGRLVEGLERRAPREGRARQLIYGGAMEVACLAAAALPAWLLQRLLPSGSPAKTLALALALKPTFAIRALFEFTGRVQKTLESGDLQGSRLAVGQIVSRNVERLGEPEVAAAAVESLAENGSDSVVAPLFYYAVLGLPGAYLYRMANTLDAMVGYRGRYEYLGKVAARVDDALNLLPARLAALATAATCWTAGGSPAGAWRGMRRDSLRTPSPNAGWPMAAMAGALGLRLEKVDHYVLNDGGRLPRAHDLDVARRVAGISLAAAVAGMILLSRGIHRGTGS
ncbi:MAG: adenosylcobinamide-phosphate synthase CbiB [Chloroflexota bacterium]